MERAEGSADGSNADYTKVSATSDLFAEGEKFKNNFNRYHQLIPLMNFKKSSQFQYQRLPPGVSIYADGVGTILINDNDSTLPVLGFVALSEQYC